MQGGYFVYYLGELTQTNNLTDWLYQAMKGQSLIVTMSNGKALPSFLKY